jgi:hypothetical protein
MKGAIHKRSPGVFLIAIDHGRDAKGKRIRKWSTFRGTKREAQDECARLITELKTGNYLEPAKTTVAHYLEHWLADVKTRVSRKTLERYAEICRNNIVPLLGLTRLSELKPVLISQAWAKALESGRVDGGPLSPRTVHHMHTILKSALEQAVDWEMLLRNPASKVDPPNRWANPRSCPARKWLQYGCKVWCVETGLSAKSLIQLAGVAGLEPATPGFGDRCSTN